MSADVEIPQPTPAERMAARLIERRGQVAALAFASGRSADDITASIQHVRVVGMPAGWPHVPMRFGGVSHGALMLPALAEERTRKHREKWLGR